MKASTTSVFCPRTIRLSRLTSLPGKHAARLYIPFKDRLLTTYYDAIQSQQTHGYP